ncbi:hypothetical protein C8R47DRAFT_1220849 [Mycena vitilis]|nr:hypothetical protein C8R47DRAFT_1220849 [Mycena vitilis]
MATGRNWPQLRVQPLGSPHIPSDWPHSRQTGLTFSLAGRGLSRRPAAFLVIIRFDLSPTILYSVPMRAPNKRVESDPNTLLAAFDNLSLTSDLAHKAVSRPSTSTAVPPRAPPKPAPASDDDDRLYYVSSPTHSGYTDSWDEAAALTQGIPGASPRKLSPKKKKRTRKGGYVVFFGKKPGVYRDWSEVAPLVLGVSGSIYQGYPTIEQADAAYEYACARSWTRVCPTSMALALSPIGTLPTPAGSDDELNPLHVQGDSVASHQGMWYVVYVGITPGVYQSSLEFSLNTVGIKGATFDACGSKALAEQRFERARRASPSRVKVVTPGVYHT